MSQSPWGHNFFIVSPMSFGSYWVFWDMISIVSPLNHFTVLHFLLNINHQLTHGLEQDIDNRNEHGGDKRCGNHPTKHDYPDGSHGHRSGACCHRQWYDAKNKRENGHHDGPEARFSGIQSCLLYWHTKLALLLCHLNNQNGILGRQTN